MKWISPAGWLLVADLATDQTGETVTKSDREIMEILESYDLTRCAHSAAALIPGVNGRWATAQHQVTLVLSVCGFRGSNPGGAPCGRRNVSRAGDLAIRRPPRSTCMIDLNAFRNRVAERERVHPRTVIAGHGSDNAQVADSEPRMRWSFLQRVVLEERDDQLVAVVTRIHEERNGHAIDIGVGYGAAHIPAVAQTLVGRFGYRPERGGDRLLAIDL